MPVPIRNGDAHCIKILIWDSQEHVHSKACRYGNLVNRFVCTQRVVLCCSRLLPISVLEPTAQEARMGPRAKALNSSSGV